MRTAALTAIVGLMAFAAPVEAYFDTGNDYFARCSDPAKNEIMCIATASSYFEMMQALNWKCNDAGVNRLQIRDVLVKYLRDNPQHRHVPATFNAILAYEQAFACKSTP
jgi:hypothetical protein